jgi:hypothetical protein
VDELHDLLEAEEQAMIGRPIFDYPAERKAPEGEGCVTCGIVLEADRIDSYCSPECYEWPDRCEGCQRGPTWCECVYTHCAECGEPLSERDQENKFRTCRACAAIHRQAREGTSPIHRKES